MGYQTVKCPRGHVFRANVYSRHQKLECPECRAAMRSNIDDASYYQPSFTVNDTSTTDWSSSSSSDSYSSGGGGDFSGGGASGDW